MDINGRITEHGGRALTVDEAAAMRRRSRKLATVGINAVSINVFVSQAAKTQGGFVVARILDFGRDLEFNAAFLDRDATDVFLESLSPGTMKTVIDEQAPPGTAFQVDLW